jgi:hypothetical protein
LDPSASATQTSSVSDENTIRPSRLDRSIGVPAAGSPIGWAVDAVGDPAGFAEGVDAVGEPVEDVHATATIRIAVGRDLMTPSTRRARTGFRDADDQGGIVPWGIRPGGGAATSAASSP